VILLKLFNRDFLTLKDFKKDELLFLIDLAYDFKKKKKTGERHSFLVGKSAALFFEKPSTRTRISLEVACNDLGIHPIYLESKQMQISRGEPIKDTARVLERYVDIIIARVYSHKTLEILAEYADIPVVNALSDFAHPLQILGDFLTIKEKIGLDDVKIAFLGDGDNNVAHSLLFGCAILGLDFRIGAPKAYQPSQSVLENAKKLAEKNHGKVLITEDPIEAVRDADIIYTDVWVSMGDEAEAAQRIKIFEPYKVSWDILKYAKEDVLFMHCLPRHEEVEDSVFESKHSIVWDQAENRLHSAKAVLASLLTR